MIDTFNIVDNSLRNQVFYFNGANGWQVWNKPPNCNLINFFLLGGGAGGQGGQVNAASTRSGGSGGGSSSVTYITVPAFAVPDTLYILVGSGGAGGVSGGSPQGGAGTLSYVCSIPDTTQYSVLIKSGSAVAGASVSSTAGLGITASDVILSEIAFISTYDGQTGGAGGSSSGAATNVTPSGLIITAGAGGAGCSSVGTLGSSASIVGILDFPTISGGTNTASAATTAGSGNNGFSTRENFIGPNFKYPMYFTGGAGGGAASNATGVGGKGGDGQYGCGGGGGGAGGNTTAGVGGRGGDGLVIITCY